MLKSLSTYKYLNVALLITVAVIIYYYYYLLSMPCSDPVNETTCIYDYKYAIYQPIYFGGKWLAIILGVLLFLPTHIFRKWLFYVAPPVILLTLYLVQDISVYSNSLLNPTRAKMTENGMFVLAAVTVVFVAVHLFLDWKKKRNN